MKEFQLRTDHLVENLLVNAHGRFQADAEEEESSHDGDEDHSSGQASKNYHTVSWWLVGGPTKNNCQTRTFAFSIFCHVFHNIGNLPNSQEVICARKRRLAYQISENQHQEAEGPT